MDEATQGVVNFAYIGIAVVSVVLIVFEILRRVTPATYYFREDAGERRELDDYDGTPIKALPRPSTSPFGWIKPTLLHPEEELMESHGLDAAFYLRYLRMTTYLFAVMGLLYAPFLLPIYGTADLKNAPEPEKVEGIAIVSLSNVEPKDWWRLTMTLLSEFVLVGVVAFFMYRELKFFLQKRLQYRSDSKRNPSNYAVVVLDVPAKMQSKQSIRDFFLRCFPGEVAEVHHVRNAKKIAKCKTQLVKLMGARECADWTLMRAGATKPDANHSKLESKLATALEKQRGKEQELKDLMMDINDSAPLTNAAIVVFNNKRTATLAASTPLWTKASEWKVERAAEPKGVAWTKLGIQKHVAFVTSVVVFVALSAFLLLWIVPVTAIQAVANLEALAQIPAFSFLREWVKSDFAQFVQGMLPQVILTVFLALVPILIRLAVGFERIPNAGLLEKKVRDWVCFFYIVSNFLYVVMAGSLLEKLDEIRNNPQLNTIIDILGTTIPAQATFLMGYILFNGCVGFPVSLLNIGRLVLRPLLKMLGAKTERKELNADASGVFYPYFSNYARAQMIAFIGLIYSNIAPLILPVTAMYFGIAFVTQKFLIMYSTVPIFESGGTLFPGAWYTTLIALYVHQLSLVGVLGLKKAPVQSFIMLVLFFASLALAVYLRKSFTRITQLGSLLDQANADNDAGVVDKVPPKFIDEYINPGLKPLEPWEAADLTGAPAEMQKVQSFNEVPELEDGSQREREMGFNE